MEYSYAPDEYLKQLKAYYALEKLSFSQDDGRETVLNMRRKGRKASAALRIRQTP